MSFFEVEFPTTISLKASGGPTLNTSVNTSLAGAEQRNRNWALARSKWQVSLLTPSGILAQTFVDLLQAFFLVVGGRADGFRLKDHKDFQFSNEQIGVGTGSLTTFQLQKTYTIGGRTYTRTIAKPIMGTVSNYKGVALPNTVTLTDNGTPIAGGSFSVNATTGIATIPTPPLAGHIIRASGQFHFPVRFDSDELALQVEAMAGDNISPIVSLNTIGLIELRAPY
jgi:uncharacterized protein (TIGR02217 family)